MAAEWELEWKAEYLVGDPIIDSQHQHLFTLANEVLRTQNSEEITRAIMQLFQYVREHFGDEESLMARRKYAGLIEHRAMHDKMIERLSEIAELQGAVNENQLGEKLQEFMVDWLLVHILDADMKIPKRVAH